MAEPQLKEALTESKLIICEGDSDCRFLEHLMARRGINGFQVVKPANGKTGFENRLRTIRANEDDLETIETILLITDNDDDPESSFERIARQVRAAEKYGVPRRPLEVATTNDYPGIIIVMFPWTGIEGGLETLILESMADKEPAIRGCLAEYLNCTPARLWNINKQSKMLLACMLAGTCEGNPVGSLSFLWKEENNLRELLDHQCFNRLVEFLLSDLNG